jgi:branched-chain amino acid transport system permease protein
MIDFFNSNQVLVQATLSGLILALSIQVPLRMGVFSFAGAGSNGLGGYAAALLIIHLDLNAYEAVGLAIVICAFVGLLLGLVISRLHGLYLAMATVAFDLIIGVVAINGGTFTGESTGLFGVIVDFTTTEMFVLTLVALVLVALSERGKVGRRVEAVRDDQQLAASAGVNVRRYRLMAFVVGGALGGLAGAMNVLVRTTIGPLDIGFGLIVLALTMIIVGGAMSWKGAVLGAIIFTWLPHFLDFIGQWQTLVYGIIVALAAIFLPRGIHGVIVDVIRWVQRRRRGTLDTPAPDPSGDAEPEQLLPPSSSEPSSEPQSAPPGAQQQPLRGGVARSLLARGAKS